MEAGDRKGSQRGHLPLTFNLILQTATPWSSCLSAALNSRASHSPLAPSWTTELCTGDFSPALSSPPRENICRELYEYYQAGGLDTTEELELALLLRDQELLNSEVARGGGGSLWWELTEVYIDSWRACCLPSRVWRSWRSAAAVPSPPSSSSSSTARPSPSSSSAAAPSCATKPSRRSQHLSFRGFFLLFCGRLGEICLFVHSPYKAFLCRFSLSTV